MERRRIQLANSHSGEGDSLFPITLVVGENGQKGIDLITYVKENFTESYAGGLGLYMDFEEGQVFVGNDIITSILYQVEYNNATMSTQELDGKYVMTSDGRVLIYDE